MKSPAPTNYQRIGGAEAIQALVDRFYGYMDTLPEAQVIRRMHNPDLTRAKDKLYKYLTGWLGGPPLYQQEHGHPRLRMRHLPFPIGHNERDQWLLCMRKALDDLPLETEFRERLYKAFSEVANHMLNQQPH